MPQDPVSLKEYVTVDALAETFGVSRSLVLRWRDSGLPIIHLGKGVWIAHEAAVAAWLKTQEKVQPVDG